MAVIETWFNQDLQKPVKVQYIDGSMFSNNGNGNRIGVNVYDNGEAVTLTGSVSGYAVLADGTTVPCTGARTGNKASILVPPAAYVPGALFLSVFLTDGTTVTTLAAVSTSVLLARTDSQVDPGTVVADWTQTINGAMQDVQTAAENLGQIVATPYASLTYPVPLGKYTYYNGNLYRCVSPIASSENFTPAHWSAAINLGDEVSNLKSAIKVITKDSSLFVENGGISLQTGEDSDGVSYRVRTGFMKFGSYPGTVTVSEGYSFRYYVYDDNFSFTSYSQSWLTTYSFPNQSRYIRIVVRKNDDSNISVPDFYSVTTVTNGTYATVLESQLIKKFNDLRTEPATFLFNPSNNANIVYNTENKTISFPTGIIYAKGKTFQLVSTTVSLTDNPDNAWAIYFNSSSLSLQEKRWSNLTDITENDRLLCTIYGSAIWVNGVQRENIRVLPITDKFNGDFAVYSTDESNTVSFDSASNTLYIPAGVVYGTFGHAINSAQTIDISSASLPANAGTIRFNYDSSAFELRGWSSADNKYPIVGAIYNSNVWLNGGFINSSYNHIGIIGSNQWCTYNPSTKSLVIPAGFVMMGGRSIPQYGSTLDLSQVTSPDSAWLIYFNRKNASFYAMNWSRPNKENYDALIGYVFGTNVCIFGLEKATQVKKKTIYFFGDSITAGVGATNLYHMILAKELNMSDINWAVGGTGYAYEYSGSEGFSGNGAEGRGSATTETGNNTILDIMTAHHDFDKCVIFAGTNDWGGNVTLESFETAVRNTLDYAIGITPDIVVITPIKRKGSVNGLSKTLEEYANVIISVCNEKSVSCYDAYHEISMNPNLDYIKTAFFDGVGVHPNNKGHVKIAVGLKAYIESILY